MIVIGKERSKSISQPGIPRENRDTWKMTKQDFKLNFYCSTHLFTFTFTGMKIFMIISFECLYFFLFNRPEVLKIQDPWLTVENYCSFYLGYPFHDLIWRFWFLKLLKISFIFYFFFYLKGSMKINKKSRATKQPQNEAKSKWWNLLISSNGLERNIEWKISAKWPILAKFSSVLFHIKLKRNILNTIVSKLEIQTTMESYSRSTNCSKWNNRR